MSPLNLFEVYLNQLLIYKVRPPFQLQPKRPKLGCELGGHQGVANGETLIETRFS